MSSEEREACIDALREEIDGLIEYYKEFNGGKLMVDKDSVKANHSGNTMIACFLEESSLSLSKLVESIFDTVKEKEGSMMTSASVKSSVLLIGQRSFYGITSNHIQDPNTTLFTNLIGDNYHLKQNRPALIVSSTTWTPDEDFGILLEAAVMYDRRVAALLNENDSNGEREVRGEDKEASMQSNAIRKCISQKLKFVN